MKFITLALLFAIITVTITYGALVDWDPNPSGNQVVEYFDGVVANFNICTVSTATKFKNPFLGSIKIVTPNFYVDQYIQDAMLELRLNPTNISTQCAEFIATIACSYMFIPIIGNETTNHTLTPCNTLCTEVCIDSYMFQNASLFPSETECLATGIPEGNIGECGTYPLIHILTWWEWTGPQKITEEPNVVDLLHPGGVARGTILGFGVLISLLLMIFGLGFIMKQQQKK
ncbi:hypothetical protein DLAC_02915 [Tieghemostelium lacteum]|uniref:FZ domain-containing protein n=1 Tax=Tieghemostelium lacteum TaxID=361077 RepID=A0A152A3N3_TIELA|nr:hypothetical protein DLAC_02915 [Tieghemostelium lacteum]|eukprot:KYR00858.1 hypothetical protein DLAC_02915 [Tieghemostelium lacteum]